MESKSHREARIEKQKGERLCGLGLCAKRVAVVAVVMCHDGVVCSLTMLLSLSLLTILYAGVYIESRENREAIHARSFPSTLQRRFTSPPPSPLAMASFLFI